MTKSNRASVICILIAGVLWGSSCLFVEKLTAMGLSPLQCTAIRCVSAAIILNSAVLVKGAKSYKISAASWGICAASGICSVLAMCVCYYYSMIYTSAAVSAILLYTAPIFVMIMSVIFFKERITLKKVAAFCVAIVGCALVSGIMSGVTADTMGIVFGVLSGLAYSLYGIFTTFYMQRNSQRLTFCALNFAFAGVGAVVISDPLDTVRIIGESNNLPLTLLFFIIFGLCTAALPYVFYTSGLSGVRPDVASILAFSEPLTAALFGITILKQPFDVTQGVGIALVILAIVMLNVSFKSKKAKNNKVDTNVT